MPCDPNTTKQQLDRDARVIQVGRQPWTMVVFQHIFFTLSRLFMHPTNDPGDVL